MRLKDKQNLVDTALNKMEEVEMITRENSIAFTPGRIGNVELKIG